MKRKSILLLNKLQNFDDSIKTKDSTEQKPELKLILR